MKTALELKQMTIPQLTRSCARATTGRGLRAYMQLVHDELETKEVVATLSKA